MSINSNKYVPITSGVGGAAAVSARELLCRVFTANELVPTGSALKFSDAESVLDYFGSNSEEYKRAALYFGFISKAITSPRNINFVRWAEVATSAKIFGAKAGTLAELNAISAGDITVTLAGVDGAITPDFSLAATYADVATELQTKIQALGGGFATATVTYNALKTQFNFNSNGSADGAIATSGDAGDLGVIGWGSNAVFSNGVAAQTITEAVSQATELTNDFGSLVFNYDLELTLADKVEIASWNVTRNNEFQYHTTCVIADAQNHFDDLNGFAGTGVTLRDESLDEYPEMLPCALLASQNFGGAAAAANYMYVQDNRLTPTVTTTALSNTLDAIRINYYGQTQEAGSQINFYQRGVLMGGNTSPTSMGVYAGEQWLKADLKAELLSMFLAMPIVAADDSGRAIAFSYLAATVAKAITNGTFAQGKKLNNTQIQYINQVSGNETAHREVAGKGYWYDATIEQETSGGVTEYYIAYTLIYAKRDAVNSVTGRHILI